MFQIKFQIKSIKEEEGKIMISICLEHLPLVGGAILFIGVAIIIYSIHKKSIGLAKILVL